MDQRGAVDTTVVERVRMHVVSLSARVTAAELTVGVGKHPHPQGTLGDLGIVMEVVGPPQFPQTEILHSLTAKHLVGIDRGSVRMFRWSESTRTTQCGEHRRGGLRRLRRAGDGRSSAAHLLAPAALARPSAAEPLADSAADSAARSVTVPTAH